MDLCKLQYPISIFHKKIFLSIFNRTQFASFRHGFLFCFVYFFRVVSDKRKSFYLYCSVYSVYFVIFATFSYPIQSLPFHQNDCQATFFSIRQTVQSSGQTRFFVKRHNHLAGISLKNAVHFMRTENKSLLFLKCSPSFVLTPLCKKVRIGKRFRTLKSET